MVKKCTPRQNPAYAYVKRRQKQRAMAKKGPQFFKGKIGDIIRVAVAGDSNPIVTPLRSDSLQWWISVRCSYNLSAERWEFYDAQSDWDWVRLNVLPTQYRSYGDGTRSQTVLIVSCSDAASALTSELTASLYTTVLMDGSFKDFHRSNQGHGCPQAGAMGHLSPGNVVECFCVLAVNSKTLNCLNQSINQSLFQAEAHGTHSKENANTGNRTEQTQTHRRIH